LAALEATLIEYVAGRAEAAIPVVRMIRAGVETIETRAEALAARLHAAGWKVSLVSGASAVGGGSAPGIELPTVLVAVTLPGVSCDALEERLRALDPPVIARIESDRVLLDLRTVFENQDAPLSDALAGLL
jgi:L-seryl-tRNA(Ser) seleniumtransferase